MTTIHDVAGRAGVSVATVSRFLAGHNVRAADAIRQAVADLDYRPNASAQSLKTGRLGTIGVVVPDISNPFFAAVVRGLEQQMPDNGFRVLLANSDESAEREAEILADLSGRVDGFILAPANEQDRAPLRLQQAGVPVVLLDREVHGGEHCDVVLVDNIEGAATAARHLLDLGHTDIATIHGPERTTPGRERRLGFTRELERAGITTLPAWDLVGDFHEKSGRLLAEQLLASGSRPTALFTANNLMTVGALKAFRDHGVAIPDTLSVIGFDDLILGSLLQPPLTCIARADEEQGAEVMRLLAQRLGGDRQTPRQRIVLPTRLEVRGSTARPGGAA